MNKKWRLLSSLFIFCLVFFVASKAEFAKASADDNVEGWAWSENIGWISFNCTNTGTCGTSNYGVNVDWATGNVSGDAWSENIGWIKFNSDADFVAYPGCGYPSSPCNSARMSLGFSFRMSGWARARNFGGGWDGWIKLAKNKGDLGPDYRVFLQTSGNYGGGQFRDWAWGGDVVGWISFNCRDDGDASVDTCETSNYYVNMVNQNPTAINLDVKPENDNPDDYSEDYCASNPVYTFTWEFEDEDDFLGDWQSGFDIQVADDLLFSTITIDRSIDDSLEAYQIRVDDPGIGYDGSTHYWRLRVYDERGGQSDWINGPSFSTPLHPYPDVDFSSLPIEPSAGEKVQFYDGSQDIPPLTLAYGSGIPIVGRLWTISFLDENGDLQQRTDDLNQDTIYFLYPKTGSDLSTNLKVTDSTGYYCDLTKDLDVNLKLPEYKEIIPK